MVRVELDRNYEYYATREVDGLIEKLRIVTDDEEAEITHTSRDGVVTYKRTLEDAWRILEEFLEEGDWYRATGVSRTTDKKKEGGHANGEDIG